MSSVQQIPESVPWLTFVSFSQKIVQRRPFFFSFFSATSAVDISTEIIFGCWPNTSKSSFVFLPILIKIKISCRGQLPQGK